MDSQRPASCHADGSPRSKPLVISLVGLHNTGKTTVGERMTRHWSDAGLRVAILKHEGEHQPNQAHANSAVDWEKPDSDTRRYAQAGAVCTVIAGRGESLWRITQDGDADHPETLLLRLQQFLQGHSERPDVILVEGFKSSQLPKVVILRTVDDVTWLQSASLPRVVAVVCPPEFARLAEDSWRVYHDTDMGRLCADLMHQSLVGDIH